MTKCSKFTLFSKIGPKFTLFSKLGPKFALFSKICSKFIIAFCSKIGPKISKILSMVDLLNQLNISTVLARLNEVLLVENVRRLPKQRLRSICDKYEIGP